MAVITEIRREKSERHMPLNAQVKKLTVYAGEKNVAEMILRGKEDIAGTCKVEAFEVLAEDGEGREIKPYNVRFVAEY